MDAPTEKESEKVEKRKLKECIIVIVVLKRANKRRFGNLQISLKNKYLLGINKYPTTIRDLLKVLNHYKLEWNQSLPNTGNGSTRRSTTPTQGASFLQANSCAVNFLRGTNNSFYSEIVYRTYSYPEHYQKHYPVTTNTSGTRIRGCQRSNEGDKPQTTKYPTTEEEVSLSYGTNFN